MLTLEVRKSSLREVKKIKNLPKSNQSVNGRFRIEGWGYRISKNVPFIVVYAPHSHMFFTVTCSSHVASAGLGSLVNRKFGGIRRLREVSLESYSNQIRRALDGLT